MRRNLQRSNLVVEESPHGEPVQRLIASPADAAVVHVSGHCHTQPLLAAPEETVTLIWYRELTHSRARARTRTFSVIYEKISPRANHALMTLLFAMNGND